MKIVLILSFIITAFFIYAQAPISNGYFPNNIFSLKTYKDFKYLQTILVDSLNEKQKRSYNQQLAQLNSFYGNFKKADKYYFERSDIEVNIDSLITFGYTPVTIEAIFSQVAKENNIIILNDAHPIAQTRVALNKILELLYKQGYRYLAMETLDERDTALNARKYPIINKTGYYSDEPCFGDMIRQSLKLGFKAVAYENYDPGIDRHLGQAMNIYNRIFKDDPDAKVIIYSGHFNGTTIEFGPGHGEMGYHLSKLTKTKPIFINQIEAYKYKDYKFKKSIMPFGLKAGYGKSYWHDKSSDINLFIPFCEECDKQDPDYTWLKYNTRDREVIFTDTPPKCNYPYLIKVLLFDEAEDSVPLQQIEVLNDTTPIKLMLYKGNYKVKCVNIDNVVFYETVLNVK